MDHKKESAQTTAIIFGHIEGLIEAWLQDDLGMIKWDKGLTYTQTHRLIQLFRLLDQGWIVDRMAYPYDTATKTTLIRLSQLVSTGSFFMPTDEDTDQEVVSDD